MSFVETSFPSDISYGSSGGPEYSTDIVVTYGGHEQRNANWAQSRAKYNVAHGIKTQGQLNILIAFFRARKGRADGFRFKDWTDHQATHQLIGTGNGTKNEFQLVKKYISGSGAETRIITKPVSGTVTIHFAAAPQDSSTYTVQYNNGLVTFLTPPPATTEIFADFEFDVPVRFDTDRLSATLDSYGSNSWYDIPLVEIRL